MARPRTPNGLGAAGRALWRRLVTDDVVCRPDELVMLEEACRVADVLATLRASGGTDARTLREIRLQQDALRKLLAAVDWPDDESSTGSSTGSRSAAARDLALARWRRSS